jgi:hypothetical protein
VKIQKASVPEYDGDIYGANIYGANITFNAIKEIK